MAFNIEAQKLTMASLGECAVAALNQVPERARQRGLYAPDGSEIVLLALWSQVQWEPKVGLCALGDLGVDRFELARDLNSLLNERAIEGEVRFDKRRGIPFIVKTGEPYQLPDFASLLKPLLDQAEREAQALSHDYVGSEHILLAVISLADSALRDILQRHKVTHARVKDAVLEFLGE